MDLTQNWKYWINPITVTLDGHPIPVAQIGQPSTDERAAFDAEYIGRDTTFLIPGSNGFVPSIGSQIVFGSTTFAVLTVQYDHLDDVYSCYTLNLAIALVDTITITRPTITYDALHAPIRTYNNVYNNIPAAVRLTGESENVDSGIMGKVENYEIVVGQQLDLKAEDRILWNALTLKFVDYKNRRRLDQLPMIIAMRQT